MALIDKTFSEVIAFTRPASAPYVNSSGQTVTAGVNVPRLTHTASGQPLGLLLESERQERAVIRNGNWRTPHRGTWVVRGDFDSSIILSGLGFYVEANGEGTIVITYSLSGSKVFSQGRLQYESAMRPTEDFNILDEERAVIARMEFIPAMLGDNEAAAMALGSVDVQPPLAALWAGGHKGFLWPSLPYYQDPAGTTVASWGDPVGLISDNSGNGADFTQATVTARPVLRNDPPRLEFDLVDDLLQTTLPAITNGTLVLAGTNGIWVDDDFSHAGGEFTVGPTTYTGGPAGILPIVGDLIVGGSFAIDRQLTAQERARVINKLKSMGAPGVFELGPELVANGGPDFVDTVGWGAASGGVLGVDSGELVVTNTTTQFGRARNLTSAPEGVYLASFNAYRRTATGGLIGLGVNASQTLYYQLSLPGTPKMQQAVLRHNLPEAILFVVQNSNVEGADSGIIQYSLRKLELVP